MTIPINPVHLGSTGVVQNQNTPEERFFQLLQTGIQSGQLAADRRARIEIAIENLRRQREQFELNKMIAGPQMEGQKLENKKKERQLKHDEEDLTAQEEANRVFTSNIMTATDPKSWGHVIASVKDPLVRDHLMTDIKNYFDVAQEHFAAAGMTPEGNAIRLNTGTGEFGVSPIKRAQPGVGGVLQQKAQMGAVNSIDVIDHMLALYDRDKTADVVPQASALMEGISGIPVVGKMARGTVEAQRQQRMTSNQQQYQGYLDTFTHNTVGLLPGSRQSIALFNNLRNSYGRLPGQSDAAGAAKIEQLRRLRARLLDFVQGKPVRLDDVLGREFSDLTPAGTTIRPTRRATQPRPVFDPNFVVPDTTGRRP